MINEALTEIQHRLVAPKGQRNTFGNYNYRSCEDILNALKPLLMEHSATVRLSDEVVEVGQRVYVKATATLHAGDETISVSAFAREPASRKGMDDAQVTGATSSYARKYALNGLFAIDDTKDADTQPPPAARTQAPPAKKPATVLDKWRPKLKGAPPDVLAISKAIAAAYGSKSTSALDAAHEEIMQCPDDQQRDLLIQFSGDVLAAIAEEG